MPSMHSLFVSIFMNENYLAVMIYIIRHKIIIMKCFYSISYIGIKIKFDWKSHKDMVVYSI